MADSIASNKFLIDLVQLLDKPIDNPDLQASFASTINGLFGVEKTTLTEIKEQNNAAVCEYVSNTKKIYTDNQLSEFSAFPELIGYRNSGYKSYAAVPVIIDGKVVSTIEMLSTSENKFTAELTQIIALGAPLIGLAISYKKEKGRNLKLATYFDAAFSNNIPQMLVSGNGSIIKANKSAMKAFNLGPGVETKISSVLNIDFNRLQELSKGLTAEISQMRYSEPVAYTISAVKINDNLFHVTISDSTASSLFKSSLNALDYNDEAALIFVDSEFIIKQATKGFGQFLDYQPELVIGKSLLEIVDDKAKTLLSGEGEKSKSGSSSVLSGTVDFVSRNSTMIRAHIVLVKSFYGSVVAVANSEAEKYVETTKENLQDFINMTNDIVIKINGLGFITECNLPTAHVFGYSKDELFGKDIKMLYEDPGLLSRDIAYVMDGGKADNTYIRLKKKDGTTIGATHYVRILEGSGREVSYIVLIKEDETASLMRIQKELIHKYENQLKNLKSNSDLKSDFIHNISHELKTPLTSIIGFSKLLYEGRFGELNEEERDNIKTILDEAGRLMLIIQQILDATKLDANKVELEFKEVDLAEMKNNPSIKGLEEAAQKNGLEFSWNVKYDVPHIMADQNRLIQVFVNLIGNAIKFTESGGIAVSIEKQSKNKVQIQVKDTGIGISPEDKQRLFRKFYQVPKKGLAKPEGAGTGLGLSITKDIIMLHHGKIKVDSELGKGSTFWFTLPINQRQVRKRTVVRAQSQANQTQPASVHPLADAT